MVVLKDIINATQVLEITGPVDRPIRNVTMDSRDCGQDCLFVAVPGTRVDGHDFIAGAVQAGAVAVVCESVPEDLPPSVTCVRVRSAAAAAGEISSAFYGYPSRQLRLVGVTGTNGKTTTATLLHELYTGMGYRCGLISTVEYRIGEQVLPSTHTTPDPVSLNRLIADMVARGCDYCFMEVSSHSIVQKRIAGLEFAGGIFTNITHDHLDYHGTFAEYIKAKKEFFDNLPSTAFALVNSDDRNGSVMIQNTAARKAAYSLRSMADYRCRILEMHIEGMLLEIDGTQVWVKLIGRFNACNLLAVYASALMLGAQPQEVLQVISSMEPVNGRFQTVRSQDGVTAIIDYAHTPDALQNVIDTVNEIREKTARFFIVAGCGGDRDPAKRPLMGDIAARGGDMAILTSDNPRSEDPSSIIAQMKAGVTGGAHLAITDRAEAIQAAVAMANAGDIILIAGKGHETYQEVCGVRNHFDDRLQVAAAFANRSKRE